MCVSPPGLKGGRNNVGGGVPLCKTSSFRVLGAGVDGIIFFSYWARLNLTLSDVSIYEIIHIFELRS